MLSQKNKTNKERYDIQVVNICAGSETIIVVAFILFVSNNNGHISAKKVRTEGAI